MDLLWLRVFAADPPPPHRFTTRYLLGRVGVRVLAPVTLHGPDGGPERLACPDCGQDSGLWLTLSAHAVCQQGHGFHDHRLRPAHITQLHDIALSRAGQHNQAQHANPDLHIDADGITPVGTPDRQFDAITGDFYSRDSPPAAPRLRVWHAQLQRDGADETYLHEIENRLASMYEPLNPADRLTPEQAQRIRNWHDAMLDIGDTDLARRLENSLTASGYPLRPAAEYHPVLDGDDQPPRDALA